MVQYLIGNIVLKHILQFSRADGLPHPERGQQLLPGFAPKPELQLLVMGVQRSYTYIYIYGHIYIYTYIFINIPERVHAHIGLRSKA